MTKLEVDRPSRPTTGNDARARLLAGLPVTERRVQLAGVSTAVLEGGSGPPVVLLHGGIESGGVYWAPVISRLAQSNRIVVPDLPGLGESEPVARMDDAAFADWLAGLVRMTCQEQPVLLAHSLDGSLAARFAANHGDLLRQLISHGRTRDRALPHAARAPVDGDPVRPETFRTQQRPVRTLGIPRPRPNPRARP